MKKQTQTKKRQTRSTKINRSKKHNKKSIKHGGSDKLPIFEENKCYRINIDDLKYSVQYIGQNKDKYLFFDQIYNMDVSLDKKEINENNVREIEC